MIDKTFAVGDVHGHYDELMALYKKLPINPKKDRLILLGDMVDNGPDTKKVIDQCIEWEKQYPHWIFLYGNHCDLLLDALDPKHPVYGDYYLWWNQGGRQTIYSYLPQGLNDYEKALAHPEDIIPKEHLEWLAKRPRWFEDDKYIYVHAGLEPRKTPEETNPYEMIWIRNGFIYSQYNWGKKIIFAHTADDHTGSFEPIEMENKIGINTMPRNEGKLTAVELPEEKFYFQEKL